MLALFFLGCSLLLCDPTSGGAQANPFMGNGPSGGTSGLTVQPWTEPGTGLSSSSSSTAYTPTSGMSGGLNSWSGGTSTWGGSTSGAWVPPVGPQPSIPFNSQSGDYFSAQGENPPVWETFPVKVHLNLPANFPDNARGLVQSAISDWKRYVPLEVTKDKSQAQIRLVWDSKLDGKKYGQTQVKETKTGKDGRPKLAEVDIKLLLPEKYGNLPANALKAVVLHEMGHALGIRKNSDVADDVMAEPELKNNTSKVVMNQVFRGLAAKGLELALSSQGIQMSSLARTFKPSLTPNVQVVDMISQRDLNTLYKLYNAQTTAIQPASGGSTYY